MTGLHADDVSWHIDDTLVLDQVSVRAEPGTTLGLLGPNGSGKSSLLRLLADLRRPTTGRVLIDDEPVSTLSRRDVARRVAVVQQEASTEADLSVSDVVSLGRTPHRSAWAADSANDARAVHQALARTGLAGWENRRWRSLSGGERQRAHIARALAQEPGELLLDEPTNHLDIAHQLELLTLIRDLPLTTVIALHDLNMAAAFCDRLVVLSAGRVVATGSPAEVLTSDLIADVYGVRCEVTPIGQQGYPHIRFLLPTAGTATNTV